MRVIQIAVLVAATSPLSVLPAAAQEKGTWALKLGVHAVDPKSDNGRVAGGALAVTVDSDTRPSVMFEYFVGRNLGIELLAAVPFEHGVRLNGAPAASVKHLPPTLCLQYHLNGGGAVAPYLGVGVNYTTFFSEKTSGPISGADLALDPSFGLAAHAGIDFRLRGRWSLGIDGRWIGIQSDASLNGAEIGKIKIDPIVYGAYLMVRF
jgi:outer membrane protein